MSRPAKSSLLSLSSLWPLTGGECRGEAERGRILANDLGVQSI